MRLCWILKRHGTRYSQSKSRMGTTSFRKVDKEVVSEPHTFHWGWKLPVKLEEALLDLVQRPGGILTAPPALLGSLRFQLVYKTGLPSIQANWVANRRSDIPIQLGKRRSLR